MAHDATKSAETSLHPHEIAQISDAFLEKYNRPGPRYTSYPTAPVWKEDFGPGDLEKRGKLQFSNLAGESPRPFRS